MPRPPAEIQEGVVRTRAGDDVTSYFAAGARLALELCLKYQIFTAILKQGSPSCGNALVNDGSFSGKKVAGQGVTAALLQAHGISVYSELQVVSLGESLKES